MNSNPNTGAAYVEQLDNSNISIIDTNADGNTYFGEAPAGSATSAAVWKIQRMMVSGSVNKFQYANGSTGSGNIWDNRTSLTYA